MRRIIIAIVSLACSVGFLLSQQAGSGNPAPTQSPAQASPANGQPGRKVGYSYAEVTRPLYIGDSTYVYLKDNVIIYHDGAVITCDSAVRYGDNRIDCFKNVVINQKTTYIYGDRVEYDGDNNVARVYAPIVKVVDNDATLYTRNFTFDLLTNIGRYFGGGIMKQGDNYMESKDGYYYADSNYMIGVGDVEMRNPDYQLRSDSVVYDMNTEVASFWTKTYIWNSKGDILSARRGAFLNRTKDYKFSSDAYILTKDQEIWADSLDYNTTNEDMRMYGNIQMRDDANGVMAFGDYAQYWGALQNGMITRDPSLVRYDRERSDTLFMRSDSMFLYSVDSKIVLTKPRGQNIEVPAGEELIQPGSGRRPEPEQADSLANATVMPDSLVVSPADSVDLSPKELKRLEKEKERRIEREEKDRKIRARLLAREEKAAARRLEIAEREARALARRNARKGIVAPAVDSTTVAVDSLATAPLTDSLTVKADSLPVPGSTDSLQRVFYAYNNVRIYSRDFQAVCDSLVGFSIDSTMHMYISPILWQGDNQMTAEVIDLYSANKQLDKAFFSGEPMMIAEVEKGTKYNQVKGRTMESFFRNNDIYKHNVDGNARTLYYLQDDKTGDYMGFLNIESADITFLIDSMQIYQIIFRTQPSYVIYPMDKIPETAALRLPGFGWHADRRPEKLAVFDRTVRESERDWYEALQQPQFPITEDLLKQRDDFIRRGVMVERNDRLTPFTIDKIRERFDPNYARNPEDEVSRGGKNIIETPVPHGQQLQGDSIPPAGAVPDSLVTKDGLTPSGAPVSEVKATDSIPVPVNVPADSVGRAEPAKQETSKTNAQDTVDKTDLPVDSMTPAPLQDPDVTILK